MLRAFTLNLSLLVGVCCRLLAQPALHPHPAYDCSALFQQPDQLGSIRRMVISASTAHRWQLAGLALHRFATALPLANGTISAGIEGTAHETWHSNRHLLGFGLPFGAWSAGVLLHHQRDKSEWDTDDYVSATLSVSYAWSKRWQLHLASRQSSNPATDLQHAALPAYTRLGFTAVAGKGVLISTTLTAMAVHEPQVQLRLAWQAHPRILLHGEYRSGLPEWWAGADLQLKHYGIRMQSAVHPFLGLQFTAGIWYQFPEQH